MPSHAMFSPKPMLPALAPFLAHRPPSAIGDAFAQLAQRLDPDRPDPGRVVVVRVRYDATETEPPTWGPEYAIYLPEKAPSVEAWYAHAQARFRDQLRGGGETPA